MRKITLTKTATLLALAMIMSLALPLLAAAAHFTNVSFNKTSGSVTGSVYSDSVTDTVYVEIKDASGNLIKTVVANANQSNPGFFDFSTTVAGSTYDELNFEFIHGTTVTGVTYHVYGTTSTTPGGGGFFPMPPGSVSGNTIYAPVDGKVTDNSLNQAFNSYDHVVVVITGEEALLSAEVLAQIAADKPNATITIKSDQGSIELPLSAIDYQALADELGVDLSELTIKVTIAQVSQAQDDEIRAAATAEGGTVVADPIDFVVSALDNDDNSIDIESFGQTYIKRTINLDSSVDASKATGATYDPTGSVGGSFTFKPSTFSTNEVVILSTSNSIYTAVSYDKSFSDVPAGHWAEEDITTLANKLVVYGVDENTFDLSREITRAEFAALVVRSLGLSSANATSNFADVSNDAWYASEVAIAAETGIVFGDGTGNFNPTDVITRQELAAMVIRAREFAGVTTTLTEAAQASLLGAFTDASAVSAWAVEELAVAVDTSIVQGMGDGTIAPLANASRAEAVAMLYRYLIDVDFIN